MRYYVNVLAEESDWNKRVIGLFVECRCDGDDQVEYYYNTTLLGKYEICEDGIGAKPFAPGKPYTNYSDCNIHCDQVTIGSGYWTKLIVAASDEEARALFKAQKWTDHVVNHRGKLEYLLKKG